MQIDREKDYRMLAPLMAPYEFKEHPHDESKIIGHWCEDGSPYEIVVPHQLRSRLIYLLNTVEHRTSSAYNFHGT